MEVENNGFDLQFSQVLLMLCCWFYSFMCAM